MGMEEHQRYRAGFIETRHFVGDTPVMSRWRHMAAHGDFKRNNLAVRRIGNGWPLAAVDNVYRKMKNEI